MNSDDSKNIRVDFEVEKVEDGQVLINGYPRQYMVNSNFLGKCINLKILFRS